MFDCLEYEAFQKSFAHNFIVDQYGVYFILIKSSKSPISNIFCHLHYSILRKKNEMGSGSAKVEVFYNFNISFQCVNTRNARRGITMELRWRFWMMETNSLMYLSPMETIYNKKGRQQSRQLLNEQLLRCVIAVSYIHGRSDLLPRE